MVQIARSDIADNFSEKEIGKNEKNCESDCCFGAREQSASLVQHVKLTLRKL